MGWGGIFCQLSKHDCHFRFVMSKIFRTLTIFYLTLTKPSFSIFYHCVSLCFESTAFHKISPVFLWKVNSGSRVYNLTILLFCCHVENLANLQFHSFMKFSPVLPCRSDLTKCLCSCLLKMISLKGRHTFIPFFWGLFSILWFMYIMAQMLDYFHSIPTLIPDMQSKI